VNYLSYKLFFTRHGAPVFPHSSRFVGDRQYFVPTARSTLLLYQA
jgi:hypothetical protein